MNILNLNLLLLPLFFTVTFQSSPKPSFPPPHFLKHNSTNETVETPLQHYFEVTLPLPTDSDAIIPACSTAVLNHIFANATATSSVSLNYTPPPETCEWSVAVLDLRVECKGELDTAIAGVRIDGVELLRTSTAQPSGNGSFWNVRKDVTRYSSVITQNNLTLSVVLQNLADNNFTGVFNVSVSLLFYSDTAVRFPLSFPSGESEHHTLNRKLISVNSYANEDILGLEQVLKQSYPYDTPADLIIPVSGALNDGFWFKIHNETDIQTTNIQISSKTYKAVLELYVSFHGDDEFWYMSPPDSYLKANSLSITNSKGAYREVLVTIDGELAGTVIPFPVIFPGGINPLFWKPVVSIGAFDLPSYDIDLTPFLGLLTDGREHEIGFKVADGISFWLVDANLHIWLDGLNVQTVAEVKPPSLEIEHDYNYEGLDGEFEIEVGRSTSSTRSVQSSNGILKTKVKEEIKLKNKLTFKDDGARKDLEQTIEMKTKIKVSDNGRRVSKIVIERTYPLTISVQSGVGSTAGGSVVNTVVIQGRKESFIDKVARISTVLKHNLNCTGWMVVGEGDSVISGFAENHQNYLYKDGEGGCYSRKVDVVGGDVIAYEMTSICDE